MYRTLTDHETLDTIGVTLLHNLWLIMEHVWYTLYRSICQQISFPRYRFRRWGLVSRPRAAIQVRSTVAVFRPTFKQYLRFTSEMEEPPTGRQKCDRVHTNVFDSHYGDRKWIHGYWRNL